MFTSSTKAVVIATAFIFIIQSNQKKEQKTNRMKKKVTKDLLFLQRSIWPLSKGNEKTKQTKKNIKDKHRMMSGYYSAFDAYQTS